MIVALIVHPDGITEARQLDPDLPTIQALVGGHIEAVSPADGDWHAYVNEEGVWQGLPANPQATALAIAAGWAPLPGDFLKGTAVFLGDGPDGTETHCPAPLLHAAIPALRHQPHPR